MAGGGRPEFRVASRSAGKAVCAMAAYRSGDKIKDHTYNKTHDYGDKDRILHSEILAPEHAPDWATDRAKLWNAVEQAETTKAGALSKAAQLARDIMVPLPHELTTEQQAEVLREWCDKNFVSAGMVADINIHGASKGGDDRNIHAHIMLTMREITPEGFHEKKATKTARSWNTKDLLNRSVDDLELSLNDALEKHGHDVQVSFQSNEARGIDQEPEQKEGVKVTQMKRRGEQSRVADENQDRRDRNSERRSRHMQALHEIIRVEEETTRYGEWQARKVAELESAHGLSMMDLETEQTLARIDHEDDLQAFYEPSLKAVQEEHTQLAAIVEGRGVLLTLRRLWQGGKDRAQLNGLQATIEDTKRRIEEARAKINKAHVLERKRLRDLQAERRRQQAAGLEKKEAEKLQQLSDRLTEAKERAQDTAEPNTELAAELAKAREARERWKAERKADLKKSAETETVRDGRGKGIDFER